MNAIFSFLDVHTVAARAVRLGENSMGVVTSYQHYLSHHESFDAHSVFKVVREISFKRWCGVSGSSSDTRALKPCNRHPQSTNKPILSDDHRQLFLLLEIA